MKRYSNKELASLNANRFAVDVLQDEAKGRDVYQPTTKKLKESIAYLHMMEETGIPYSMLSAVFRVWEEKKPSQHLSALIVFTADSFDQPYSLIQRSYIISSHNKAFMPNMASNSIFGDSLDGNDRGVKLSEYMASYNGGKDGWRVETCYLLAPNFCFPACFA